MTRDARKPLISTLLLASAAVAVALVAWIVLVYVLAPAY